MFALTAQVEDNKEVTLTKTDHESIAWILLQLFVNRVTNEIAVKSPTTDIHFRLIGTDGAVRGERKVTGNKFFVGTQLCI